LSRLTATRPMVNYLIETAAGRRVSRLQEVSPVHSASLQRLPPPHTPNLQDRQPSALRTCLTFISRWFPFLTSDGCRCSVGIASAGFSERIENRVAEKSQSLRGASRPGHSEELYGCVIPREPNSSRDRVILKEYQRLKNLVSHTCDSKRNEGPRRDSSLRSE